MLKTAFVAATALAALAGAAPASAKTEINMWFGLSGRLQNEVLAQCDRFNKSQDLYTIKCTREGDYDEIFQKAMAAVRAGNQPHILQVVDRGTGTMMLSGAVIPAYQLAEEQGLKINWDDYFPVIGNYYAGRDGKLWAFPFNSSTAMVYYNTDALKAAGYTTFPDTWEGFDDLLVALRDKAGSSCPLTWNIDLWSDMEQFSAIHNVPVASKNNGYDGLDAQLELNKTIFVKHMERQKRWFDAGLAKYDPNFNNRRDMFVTGRCAIMFDSIAGFTSTDELATPKGTKWTVAQLPHNKDVTPINSLVGGAALWTMKGFSKDEYKAVGAFYQFIAQPEQQKLWSDGTGYIPVTKSAYNELVASGYYKQKGKINRDLAVQSLTRAAPTPLSKGVRLGNYVEIRNIITEELQKALNNQVTVQQAIDTATTRGNQLLKRFADTYAGRTLP
ncbi:extracellular solute-binding protein [Rhizobium sp. XQZ8]|uniref:extracellular solute-binding protein n=1 Tax=Rhizobium populisoli TaxID=2859785 RepID=UPI001CA47343|nr:extracellular solute-binding protein [Rhizobium populisoli]MBW6424981.1 extracellular solute-binding protein [Rhizobium populisoli]